jgi:RHS repeat-associated protein
LSNACSATFQKVTIAPPSQNNSSGQCGVGDPCFPSNGNSEATEHGFTYGNVSFDLYYNSLRQTRPYSYIDENWSDTYATRVLTEWAAPQHIASPDTGGDQPRMTVQDEEAHVETYLEEATGSGIYRSTNTIGRILRWYPQSGSTPPFWELYYPNGTINVFDRAGRLIQIVHPDDPRSTLTISYLATFNYPVGATTPFNSDTAHLSEPFWRVGQVTDGTGRYVKFTYSQDQYYWLQSIVADDGVTTLMSFGYANSDNVHRLTSTTQFGQTRQYLYNEPANIGVTSSAVGYWLTGIVDELNQRFATYQYDNWGRATGSWHGTNAEQVSIAYPSDVNGNPIDGQAIATLPLGKTDTYAYSSAEPYRHPGTITDSNNNITHFYYDDANGGASTYRKLKTKDANGNVTQYQYDTNAAHETVTTEALGTPEQRQTQTDWDVVEQNGAGVPITNRILAKRIYDANGKETESNWVYNSNGQISARCDYDPAKATPASYACGSSIDAPAGVRQWLYSYCTAVSSVCPSNQYLQVVNGPRRTTDAGMNGLDDTTTYSYYTSTQISGCGSVSGSCYHSGDLKSVQDALGHITTYKTYDAWGHPVRIQDANGIITDMTYSPRGWLLTRIIRANSDGSPNSSLDATTNFGYDSVGNVKSIVQPDGVATEFDYDAAHRLTDIYDSRDIVNYKTNSDHIQYTLDAAGNRTGEQIFDSTGGLRRTLSRNYNELNQLLNVLNSSSIAIQQFENPPEPAPNGIQYNEGYDGDGNAIYSVDGNGIGTEQQYDPLNRLKTTLQDHAGRGSTKDTTTQYAYDARNNLLSVTDPDNLVTRYTYDGLNNLTQLSGPDTGTTLYPSFDGAGNRLSMQDANQTANGTTITYSYDALNRLTGIVYPDTSLNVTYAYDQPNSTTGCAISFPIGRLTTMTDSSGSTTYCYDLRGNVMNKVQVTDGVTLTTGYTYNLADRLASITYPSGDVISYWRDGSGRIGSYANGRITSVSYQPAGGSAVNIVNNVSYYPFGPANVLTFANGRTLTKSYDRDYAISRVASSDINSLAYSVEVDPMGNVKNVGKAANLPPLKINTYDPLYRFTGATDNSGNVLEAYSYGLTGDRLTKTYQGQTDSYDYTDPLTTHRLLGIDGTLRDYDANGNVLAPNSGNLPAYTFDDRNRMNQVHISHTDGTCWGKICTDGSDYSVGYDYNGRGERVEKQIVTANFIRVFITNVGYMYNESGQLLGEYPVGASDVTPAEYIYLDGTPIAYVTGGQLYYIETDQLGTPRTVVKPGTPDTIVWKWDYFASAFGENAPNQDPGNTGTNFTFNLRFPGQYFDSETGLNYNYFRDYEPGTGRYVESDPIGLGSGLNSYTYVDSNSLFFRDSQGTKPEPYGMLPSNGWPYSTIMCDGHGGIIPYIWPGYTAKQLECYGDCLRLHEESHAGDYEQAAPGICANKPRGLLLHDPSWYATDKSEIKAYGASIRCLKEKIDAIQRNNTCPNCLDELTKELNQEEGKLNENEYDVGHHKL